MLQSRRHSLHLPFIIAALCFLPLLGRKDIVTSHEARVAQTARTMASVGAPWNGASVEVPTVALVRTEGVLRLAARPGSPPMHVNPWFVPVINDQVRLQKPPLPYWCAAAFFRFFSTNEAWGRLVPALLGFASTFLIMSIARRTYGESSELWAGLIWATTFFVIDEHRKSMADPYLAFATLLCVWAWVRAIREPRGSRWVLAMFYAGLGVGFLAKGPVIFLHVAFAVGAFTLSRRKLRPLIPGGWIAHVIGVLILLVLIVPWPLYVLMKIPNAPELWRYESIGEISDNTQKARAWWQYFPSLLQITLPWTPLMLIGIVSAARRRHRWFPLAWLAAAILFFSLLHAKKNAYLLPVMPAAVLLAVDGLRTVAVWIRRRSKTFVLRDLRGAVTTAAIIFAAILIPVLGVFIPNHENARSPRAFCKALYPQLQARHLPLCAKELAEEASFYLPLDVPKRFDAEKSIVIVDDRPNSFSPSPGNFANRFTNRTVTVAERIALEGIPDKSRWKAYVVTTEPLSGVAGR